MKAARPLLALSSCVALLALGAGCSEPAGVMVDVDVSGFQAAQSLRLVFRASPGGFEAQAPSSPEGKARVTTQDVDGNGELALVTEFFVSPASPKVHFRIAAGNRAALTITADAQVFDTTKLIALGNANANLAIGGQANVNLSLTAYTGQVVVSPQLRSTDLQSASADVVIKGTHKAASIKAMAVCDFDKDGHDDVALGVPEAAQNILGATGAVYIVFGDGVSTAYELGKGREFHFFSNQGGAKLGAAVACADLNGDGFDDLIVGAPGTNNGLAAMGAGKVYVVFGRPNLNQTAIALADPMKQPDITWTTATTGAALGSALFATGRDGTEPSEILASAPGASLVHLFAGVAAPPAPVTVDADKPDHPTFAGVKATSLGAGRFAKTTGARDVVIGDSEYRVMGAFDKTGGVFVFAAVPTTSTTAYMATGATTTILGAKESGFGASVLALDTTGSGQDLFVGAPTGGADTVGQVLLYEHDGDFFVAPNRPFMSFKKDLNGSVPAGEFGRAIAGTATGVAPAETWRLLVGAPGAKRGANRPLAGAAYMFGGGNDRAFAVLEEVFGAASGDLLGTVVAGGRINADDIGDLLTVAPGAAGTELGAGVAYVKLGQ